MKPKGDRRRLVYVLLVAILVGTVVIPLSAARAACGEQNGQWVSVSGPNFGDGPQAIVAFAIDSRNPRRMFASNGPTVMRSQDGGCSWRESLVVAEETSFQRPVGEPPRVKSIAIPEGNGARVYLLLEEQVGPATRPHVMVSANGGNSWTVSDTALPPLGTPGLLRAAPSNPAVAYLTVDVAGASDALFATQDGGGSWQLRSRVPTGGLIDMKIDPLDAQNIWLGGATGLFHSTDGGLQFEAIPQFADAPAGPIDVFHGPKGPARLFVFSSAGPSQVSENGGRAWLQVSVPSTPNSVAHGDFRESIVMSTGRGVYAWAPTVLNWVDLNAPRAGIRGLLADRTSNPSFYGHTTRTVEIYSGPTGEDPEFDIPEDIIEIPDISLLDVAPPDVARQTTLTPKQTTVRLDIGKRRTVTYDVGVPRTLTPLDVFFVVDTSSSMTQVIKEAAEALETIYRGLASSGAAVQFGLAEYRSYPIDIPPKSETDNYVYRRVLDVGSTTAQMEDAIEGLTAAGGGVYDAQLEALWQAATGNGADVWPPGPSSRDVPPGIQANFRKNALRVVLHVGDEPFGREDSASDSDNTVTRPESELAKPDIPEFETVAAALRANGVKQLGLSLYPDATPDLRRMADATGAFAPPGGVDCDRDGSTDVPAGEPLVCVLQQDEIDDANMAPAIVELVEAVRTKSSVGLKVDPERDGVLQSVSPDRYNQVLLQADSSLEFDVTYRCPESLAGKEIDVDLQATGLIGTPPVSQTRVVCAEIPPDKPPLGIPFDRFVALVPLIPIGPPPPPVNVSSATQAQAQAQANAAFAAQEQEQPQVAMVHQLHADAQSALAREEQYSFTSLRKDPGPPVELWGAALLMSAGFGVAMNTQRRTRLRFAKVRSRR